MRTFSLGAGADTVVFESTSNGEDKITNFTAGASNGDVLAISGLLGATFGGTSKFVGSTGGTGAGNLETSGTQVLIHAGSTAINATTPNNSFGTSGGDENTKYKIGTSQKLFVVDTVNNANILYLVDEGNSNLTVTKVGTLNAGSDITSLVADNFGNVA